MKTASAASTFQQDSTPTTAKPEKYPVFIQECHAPTIRSKILLGVLKSISHPTYTDPLATGYPQGRNIKAA